MDEKTAKALRGRAKSSLTRISNFINDENENRNKHDLLNKISRLEVIYADFDKADAALPEEQSEITDFEEKYYDTKVKLQTALENMCKNVNNDHAQNNVVVNNFKLPRLNIPSFSGKYIDWPPFKDLYVSLVHKNESLSDIQKFQYLKGLLSEEPAAIIKHMPISEASYAEAWDKLLARYDRKKQIISSLIKTFFDQSPITHANAFNLRGIADTSDEVIRGLKSLDTQATSRDVWLIYILLQKVDPKTREEWAQFTTKEDFPTFEQFIEFLNNRCIALESYNESKKEVNEKREVNTKINKSIYNEGFKCIKCKANHLLFRCPKFKELSVYDRQQFVRKNKVCQNCLSQRHNEFNCNSPYTCHFCKEKHHSMLHNSQKYSMSARNTKENQNSTVSESETLSSAQNSAFTTLTETNTSPPGNKSHFALLPTAAVLVRDSSGHAKEIRLMCDTGSQSTFISEACVNWLGIKRQNARFPISGLAETKIGVTRGSVKLHLLSRHDPEVGISVEALILDQLTADLPSEEIKPEDCSHLNNIKLADPKFALPNKIDLIMGSDSFFSILLPGLITCFTSSLIAQNTIFGFIVSGKLPDKYAKPELTANLHVYELNIDTELRRFWEMEEIPNNKNSMLTTEEQFVETHFQETHSLNSDGRFVVKLPFYKQKSSLGGSKHAAKSRLFAMERKFKSDSNFENEYKDFMREYETLGHMEKINDCFSSISDENNYFLPHHAVLKPSSTTTRLRVVFDASCQTTTGTSLNSILGVGPKLQRDIFEILLNFRFPKIVFTSDIEKMYRQILVHDEDQNYQQILWRYDTNDEISSYKLKTVTYGLASASYLATRCIKQIALDCTSNPTVKQILLEDVYMDDLISGANSVNDAITICRKITSVLHDRGFNLRKWNSNSPEFLSEFLEHCSSDGNFEITPESNTSSKVLGLCWNSSTDTFNFKTALELTPPLSKRRILSESARMFDPLGLLSPCTVVIKIFYQKLWLTKGDWDSPIPQHLEDDWFKFQTSFNRINHLSIPRCVTLQAECPIEFHGFSDASSLAYAAAIYCRQTYNGTTKVGLLVSKTKVAPIKQVSIPRLELSAAHLLSKLFRAILSTLRNNNFEIFGWTDSKVVLAWLSSHPRKWKTFVANRTSQIMEVIPAKHWNHVPSKENPADIASRGISPEQLPQCELWWNGPRWLQFDKSQWPQSELNPEEIRTEAKAEQRSDPIFANHVHTSNELLENLFERHSSLFKIIRIVAYCQRFFKKREKACKVQTGSTRSDSKLSISLSLSEIEAAETTIIRWIQSNYFAEDIVCIKEQKNLVKKSHLRSLHPFVDKHGLLRVGGRLQNSTLSFNAKHPIILPYQHKFSELLIKERHIANLHAGPTLLSHLIRQSYWIIKGKRLINNCINKCVKCYRFKRTTSQQLMGNLPKHRVTFERPFFKWGVDYAGPISIKLNKYRNSKTSKGYIALFICLSTKAVHIEAVSDLTADAFIAALRRFSSRRGAPRHIFSDNATNFVGARRKLELQQLVLSLPTKDSVSHYLTQVATEWHFIPPASPHFGGIWEAGIRSMKYHLRRSLGTTLLTFEELTTLLTQIEALLNSRPITHVASSDTDSINCLTPSHFLTGDVLTSIADGATETTSWRSRWELVQNMRHGFWKK